MSEEFDFRKGDIVKQRNTSVLDIYGEVIVADSYQRNHMIVDFGKSRGQILYLGDEKSVLLAKLK